MRTQNPIKAENDFCNTFRSLERRSFSEKIIFAIRSGLHSLKKPLENTFLQYVQGVKMLIKGIFAIRSGIIPQNPLFSAIFQWLATGTLPALD